MRIQMKLPELWLSESLVKDNEYIAMHQEFNKNWKKVNDYFKFHL
jgi:hypothetical protein